MRNSMRRSAGVAALRAIHLPLHLDRTARRIDDAGKLDQEAVAGGFDDAATMLGDFGIAEFPANLPQRRERALFVLAHQPRITGDVGRQNGGQSSLELRATPPAGRPGAGRRRRVRELPAP
jgi:hypothetical protein